MAPNVSYLTEIEPIKTTLPLFVLTVFASLFMRDDPCSYHAKAREAVCVWLDDQARAFGYADWVDMYHSVHMPAVGEPQG